jgi:hypothetical protein
MQRAFFWLSFAPISPDPQLIGLCNLLHGDKAQPPLRSRLVRRDVLELQALQRYFAPGDTNVLPGPLVRGNCTARFVWSIGTRHLSFYSLFCFGLGSPGFFISVARRRDCVIDLDIKGFFDNIVLEERLQKTIASFRNLAAGHTLGVPCCLSSWKGNE